MWVAKKIRGKYCTFAWGKHLTLEKARLIAGKVGELSETTNDKTEIMKGLIPFAKKHNIALGKPRSAENKHIHKEEEEIRSVGKDRKRERKRDARKHS